MYRKYLMIILFAFILLGTAATVTADQNGRDCWCNIDEYGCWITNEDNGKTYLMFWSEEARQYIMGTGSEPFKFVVRHPGFIGRLTIDCGSPKTMRTVIPTATPTQPPTETQEPDPEQPDEPQGSDLDCRAIRNDCADLCLLECDEDYLCFGECNNWCEVDYVLCMKNY